MVPYGRKLYEAHGDVWHGIEESQNYMDRKLAFADRNEFIDDPEFTRIPLKELLSKAWGSNPAL